jgi:hypothetical protein
MTLPDVQFTTRTAIPLSTTAPFDRGVNVILSLPYWFVRGSLAAA